MLIKAWECQQWNALPKAGGIDDQPAGILQKMAYLSKIYTAASAYTRSGNTAKWAEANPQMWEIYAAARTMELNHGE